MVMELDEKQARRDAMAAIINERQRTIQLLVNKNLLVAMEADLLSKLESNPTLALLCKETRAKREFAEAEIELANAKVRIMEDAL